MGPARPWDFLPPFGWWRGVAAVLAVCAVGCVCCRFRKGGVSWGGVSIYILILVSSPYAKGDDEESVNEEFSVNIITKVN